MKRTVMFAAMFGAAIGEARADPVTGAIMAVAGWYASIGFVGQLLVQVGVGLVLSAASYGLSYLLAGEIGMSASREGLRDDPLNRAPCHEQGLQILSANRQELGRYCVDQRQDALQSRSLLERTVSAGPAGKVPSFGIELVDHSNDLARNHQQQAASPQSMAGWQCVKALHVAIHVSARAGAQASALGAVALGQIGEVGKLELVQARFVIGARSNAPKNAKPRTFSDAVPLSGCGVILWRASHRQFFGLVVALRRGASDAT